MSCGAGDACGVAGGELAGIGIPGVCVVWGAAAVPGDVPGVGITIPGVCVWRGAAVLLVGLASFGLRGAGFRFALRFPFRFGAAFGFGFALLIPGILWPSCCAIAAGDETRQNNSTNDQIITGVN